MIWRGGHLIAKVYSNETMAAEYCIVKIKCCIVRIEYCFGGIEHCIAGGIHLQHKIISGKNLCTRCITQNPVSSTHTHDTALPEHLTHAYTHTYVV